MATEFKLPELGENIESADVLSILVKPGDKVKQEQSIIEIETDKATVEVPSSVAGTIKEILIKEGDSIKVGQTILVMENGEGEDEKKQSPAEVKEKEPEKDKKEEKPQSKSSSEKTKKSQTENNGKSKEEKSEKEVKDNSKKSGKSQIVELKLPDLGENIESADILNVLIKKGDQIKKDQGIIEIETDKATVEVPSSYSGKVTEVLVKAGDKLKVDDTILKIETSEEEEVKEVEQTAKHEETEEPKIEKKEVSQKEDEALKGERKETRPGEIEDQPPFMKNAAPAAPSVRKLARELGVEIQQISGSGPRGRISLDDVKLYVKNLNQGKGSFSGAGIPREELPDFTKFGEVEHKPMSKIRSTTAFHLSYAWSVIPHVTQYDKADITDLEKMRKALNPEVEKAGGKLTITSILLKVSTAALKAFPQFNSSIDLEKKEIIYKKYLNIGVAVDTENGLLVPVLKNVESKNLTELSIELNSLAEKAKSRKISLEEMQGACFTITNLGGIGGTYFSPIVNSPEVAILGVSRGKYEPVYDKQKGNFEPRLMLPLSLSYDHRIIDGADAARFLRWVCEVLENPIKLLMD